MTFKEHIMCCHVTPCLLLTAVFVRISFSSASDTVCTIKKILNRGMNRWKGTGGGGGGLSSRSDQCVNVSVRRHTNIRNMLLCSAKKNPPLLHHRSLKTPWLGARLVQSENITGTQERKLSIMSASITVSMVRTHDTNLIHWITVCMLMPVGVIFC